jgi:phosphopantothenoylcysteine decarboxylase/phosphopantothenate--cysteine ligase
MVNYFDGDKKLKGKQVLVTAGPTHEAIDPVRFIGNHSTGKMGLAIATAFAAQGAEVILICGPGVQQLNSTSNINRIDVIAATEMQQACVQHFKKADITIMAAAVADYKPAQAATQKIKKKGENLIIDLVKNPDILQDLGTKKTAKQLLIGFALETQNELAHAKDKLKRKNLDAIILNSLNDKGAGFGADTNKVTFIFKSKKNKALPLMSKQKVAEELVLEVIKLIG